MCKHEALYFGSGAFYIFCRDCQQSWVACMTSKGGKDTEPDYSQGQVAPGGGYYVKEMPMPELKDLEEYKNVQKALDSVMAGATEYDPHTGRTIVPARKVAEIKEGMLKVFTECFDAMYKNIKSELTRTKVNEMDPEKSYFIVMPKDHDNINDIEELIKMCKSFNEAHPEQKGTRVLLSRGLDITEDRNGAVIESLMDAIRSEVEKALANGQAEQQASIDGAMNEGAVTVAEIERKIINQRAVFNKAADHIIKSLTNVGTKLADKYYIVDKASLKK